MMRAMASKSSASPKGRSADAAKVPSKSKAIKRARKALVKALESHAEIVAERGVPLKRAQRAGAKLAAAAAAYADAVQAKTGLENPFIPGSGMLDGESIKSLQAELVQLEKAATASIPMIPADADDAPPA